MQSDRNSEVVPAVTGIKQSIVVLVVGAREKNDQSALDIWLEQL
jgi:hypothetical protein